MKRTEDLRGQKFGRLLVIEKSVPKVVHGQNNSCWSCLCDCGTTVCVMAKNIKGGFTKSCGCMWRDKTGAAVGERKPEGVAASNSVLQGYKRDAKDRGYEWKISKELFLNLAKSDCAYCGAKPHNTRRNPRYNGAFVYNGIDRIDNLEGYVEGNVVPCCRTCNRAKGSLGHEEFMSWIKRLSEYNKI